MSQRIYYEIDGKVEGPVSLSQLHLLAGSGRLQPQHKVRAENSEAWLAARQVKGLFASAAAPPAVLYGKPVAAPPAPPAEDENPMGGWEDTPPPVEPERIEAFDFFGDPAPAPVAAPPPKKAVKASAPPKPSRRPSEKPAKSEPAAFELPHFTEPAAPLADSMESVGDNPFGFAGAAPIVDLPEDDQATVLSLPAEEEDMLAPAPPAPAMFPTPAPEAAPTPAKAEEQRPEPPRPAPRSELPPPKPEAPTREEPSPAASSAAEVSGQAVELIGDDTARLLDGKTTFRLHRAWLLASSKFNDGTSRAVYIRLQRIDAGVLETRLGAKRGKGGPYPVLSFVAGDVRVSLAFQGNDRLYRIFLEKVILMSNVGKK